MNKSPCRDCEDRSISCHSECKSYLEYRKVIDGAKKYKDHQKEATSYTVLNALRIRAMTR